MKIPDLKSLIKITDKINHRVNKILFDECDEPQIYFITDEHSQNKGTQEKDIIKIYLLEHSDLKDLIDTIVHELAHYYLNYSFEVEFIHEEQHSPNFEKYYTLILEEPAIWRGIKNVLL